MMAEKRMTDDGLTVAVGERDVVRVFAINLPDKEAKRFITNRATETSRGTYPLREGLGVETLNDTFVDAFPVDDLKGLGLTAFLAEGHGVPAGQLTRDRVILDALTGHVAVITSSAFGGKGVRLKPGPELTLIRSYEIAKPAKPKGKLRSKAAEGVLTPTTRNPKRPRSGKRPWLGIAMLAVLALLIAWVIFGASGQ